MPTRLDDSSNRDLSDERTSSCEADALIESHQRLVTHIAWKLKRRLCVRTDIADLIGYGQLGLIEAARRFQADRNVCFSTFAHYRIRGAIFDGIRKMTWLPPAARVRMAAEEALDDVALSLQAEDPADAGGLQKRVDESLRCLGAVYTFSHLGMLDTHRDPISVDDPMETVERNDLSERVRHCLSSMDEKEESLIRWHYFEGVSLTECAARLRCGKPWATRLHQRALKKLWTALVTPTK